MDLMVWVVDALQQSHRSQDCARAATHGVREPGSAPTGHLGGTRLSSGYFDPREALALGRGHVLSAAP